MPMEASIMLSSQLPFVFASPAWISGRYAVRSMVANLVTLAAGHPV